ncbi:MAG TPA: diaminopimelate decarboxylase [Mycobacteriales bacterium]|nr:diaminopimelate decarboxylase [Mycobacteriales bacterium]
MLPTDLHELDPAIWPRNAHRDSDGVLTLGGIDVRDLAATYGTAAYIVDEADFRSRCQEFLKAFAANSEIHYAAKAFCSTRVLQWVAQEGLALDVCTGGELAVALKAGFPVERIAMHGNNKSAAELTRAVEAGIGRVVVDSFAEIARLAAIAEEKGIRQAVMLRLTVGVEAHTHEFIATAHEDQKFGFSLASGAAAEAVRRILSHPSLELIGVHSHIGSQIFDSSGFEIAARRAVEFLVQTRAENGLELPVLDLGGGLGIAYVTGDDPVEVTTIGPQLLDIVRRECEAVGYPVPRVDVEPGRAIVGPGTVTLYEVGTVKNVDGIRTYVSVDGGMSDNIRTALYDASYTCVLASRRSEAEPMLARVVGKHCESGDIVVRDVWLPSDVVPGDLLAVAATGAYCRSMANNYNHVPRPPVIAVNDGRSTTLIRRETEADLLRLDGDGQ